MRVTLRPHQENAVEQLRDGCVLWGGVGSGKTIAALAYYMKHHSDKDLYVFTTARKRDSLDWEEEAALFGIGRQRDGTVAGTITVDSWNNIGNYTKVENAFVIADEQRLVGKGAWVKSFLVLAKHNRWILLSATPGDNWMDFCPIFIANGFYKNRTEFIRRHVVYNNFSKFPKIDRYVDTGILQKYRRSLLVHMPYARATTRHVRTIPVEHDRTLFEKVTKERWHIYEDRPLKDVGEMFLVMRKLVNSDQSRLAEVRTLFGKHPKLIVFYNFNHELEALRSLMSSMDIPRTDPTSSSTPPVEFAEWNGHRHEEIPKSESWIYLVQYTAGAEAWNCITTDAMVFYSLNYSFKIFEQAQGRIDRMNTKFVDLYYYVLRSNSMIDGAIWKSVMGKQAFNEKAFAKKQGFV